MFLFQTRIILLVLILLVQDCLAEQICVRAQYVTPDKRYRAKHKNDTSQNVEENNLVNLFEDCEIVLLQWPDFQNRSNDDKILTRVNNDIGKYGGEFLAYDLPVSMPDGSHESILYFRKDAFKHVIARKHSLNFTDALVVDFYPWHNAGDGTDFFMLMILMTLETGTPIIEHRNELYTFVESRLSEIRMAAPAAVIGHYGRVYGTVLEDLILHKPTRPNEFGKSVGCRAVLFNTMTTADVTELLKCQFSLVFFYCKPMQLILDMDKLFQRRAAVSLPRFTPAAGAVHDGSYAGPSHWTNNRQSGTAQPPVDLRDSFRSVSREGSLHDGDAGGRLGLFYNQQHGPTYNPGNVDHGHSPPLRPHEVRHHNGDIRSGAVTGQRWTFNPSGHQPGRFLPYASSSKTARDGQVHPVDGRHGHRGDHGRRSISPHEHREDDGGRGRSPQELPAAASGGRRVDDAIQTPLQRRIDSAHPIAGQGVPLDLSIHSRHRYPDPRRDNDGQHRAPTPPAAQYEVPTYWSQFKD